MEVAIAAIARPVAEFGSATGRVVGRTRHAIYADFDGFVVTITAAGTAMMPAAISVHGFDALPVHAGDPARLTGDALRIGVGRMQWSRMRPWEPALSPCAAWRRGDVLQRGRELMLEAGTGPAIDDCGLFRALVRRDVAGLERSAESLVGRGPGLTPEGDDLLAAVAAAATMYLPSGERTRVIAALRPRNLFERTTAISATLLELALAGCAPEPVAHLLDVDAPRPARAAALVRLLSLGHSTGRTWVAGCGRAAAAIAGTERSSAIHANY